MEGFATRMPAAAQMPAATVAPSSVERRPVRRRAVNIGQIEGHFPLCFTRGSPTCTICLSTIEATSPCRKTTCNHEFHADCIMTWWTKEKGKVINCPTCRQNQRVTVTQVRQVNLEVRQKEQECRVTTDQHSSQSQEQRQQEEPQGPLTRMLKSVRGVFPKRGKSRSIKPSSITNTRCRGGSGAGL